MGDYLGIKGPCLNISEVAQGRYLKNNVNMLWMTPSNAVQEDATMAIVANWITGWTGNNSWFGTDEIGIAVFNGSFNLRTGYNTDPLKFWSETYTSLDLVFIPNQTRRVLVVTRKASTGVFSFYWDGVLQATQVPALGGAGTRNFYFGSPGNYSGRSVLGALKAWRGICATPAQVTALTSQMQAEFYV